jgi:hypothetical protein
VWGVPTTRLCAAVSALPNAIKQEQPPQRLVARMARKGVSDGAVQ